MASLIVVAGCGGGGSTDRHAGPDAAAIDAGAGDAAGGSDGGGGDASVPDAAVSSDARSPDAATSIDAPPGDGCASPPVASWIGHTRWWAQGGGPHDARGADVTWTLASTTGCIDRYAPSGTAWIDNTGPTCELNVQQSHAIAPADGTLAIDRTTSPPTYDMTGSTSWSFTPPCPDPMATTVVSHWADYRGVIDQDVFGGGVDNPPSTWDWRFTRADAVLPPPTGCAEPAVDRWTGVHAVTGPGTDDLTANVTWTRASTDGCVDHFVPSGTATIVKQPQNPCTMQTFDPEMGTVEPGDGALDVDRSTNPPTFTTHGSVGWPVTVHCTHADGTVETYASIAGGSWDHHGPLDGDIVDGVLRFPLTEERTRLVRGP